LGSDTVPYHADELGEYYRCDVCDLIIVSRPPLAAAAERERYALHRNDPDDAGYVAHLRRLADPVIAATRPGARGLDFGCGPTLVLADLLTRSGRPTAGYDVHFFPDSLPLQQTYDFVVASEVVEHLSDPRGGFDLIAQLVRPGGVVGIMTQLHTPAIAFDEWWYRRDPTHVTFYSERTMHWIARDRGWSLSLPSPGVAVFRV
jgi:SAM-dependent methyltransferase